MNIIVCVKQVPDTADIKWTEKNTLNREGVESITNPCDLYATDIALKIKEKEKTTTISMGPIQAISSLREVLALGIDEAFLLNDKNFAGSDTAATARVLAAAIKNKIEKFDLIICGQYAIDGDTAQTGPSLAQLLNISLVTNVIKIENIKEKSIIVQKQGNKGIERIEATLPALICVQKNDYEIKLPTILGRIKAQDYQIPIYNAIDININGEETGFKGSPTYVKKAFKPEGRAAGEIITDKTSIEAAEFIINKINDLTKG